MRFNDETVEQVKAANDIVDVIGQFVKLEKKGANYFGLCPFHGEKTASFSVSPRKQIYYCFGCQKGGNVLNFVMEYENFSFTEAVKHLADRVNMPLADMDAYKEDRSERDLKEKLLQINKEAAYFYHDKLMSEDGKRALEYFKDKRRLAGATITHFGLGYSSKTPGELYRYLKEKGYTDGELDKSGLITIDEKGPKDKFWNRAMFPIMDTNNRVIGFGGRVLGDGMPKYLNSPETPIFNKSNILYGLNFARKSREKFFLICEGYMDVIALHQAGFTNAVATLGTALTEQHARLIKRYTDTVILTQDSDEAGVKARIRAFPILHDAGLKVKIINMGAYKDPDEFIKANGPDAYRKCINESKNAFLYIVDCIKAGYDLSDPAAVTDFYKDIAERLTVFTDDAERNNYIKAVCREQLIEYNDLKELSDMAVLKTGRKPVPVSTVAPVRKQEPEIVADPKLLKCEDLLLYWMATRPDIIPYIEREVSPEEYGTEIRRLIASEIYAKRNRFVVSDFIDRCREEADRSTASTIFIGQMYRTEDDGIDDRSLEKLLTESLRTLKSGKLDQKIKNAGSDLLLMQRLLKEKEKLRSIQIKIESK
ncbi:MAG: DNA primase [Eubacteriales bacterium]|nr:DNA primase [Eubacteriales bacterium]